MNDPRMWDALVKAYEDSIDKPYTNEEGDVFIFYGIVHRPEGFYYGLTLANEPGTVLLDCDEPLEYFGFTPKAMH